MVGIGHEVAIIYKPAIGTEEKPPNAVPVEAHIAELAHFGLQVIHASGGVRWKEFKDKHGAPLFVNIFVVSFSDWVDFQQRVSGAFGFRLWIGSTTPELDLEKKEIRIGSLPRVSVEDMPALVRDLIGKKCRVYRSGESSDLGTDPNRVNIETNSLGEIMGIWLG